MMVEIKGMEKHILGLLLGVLEYFQQLINSVKNKIMIQDLDHGMQVPYLEVKM